MRRRFPLILLALGVGLAACQKPPHFRESAQTAAATFRKTLQSELKAAIATGGPAHAIEVCATRATAIATECAPPGTTLRRIGTRVRNPANAARADDQEVLATFAKMTPTEPGVAYFERSAGESWARYEPLWIGDPVCLVCHGPVESLAPDVRTALAARYPADAATGYSLGDLRGAIVVESAR